MIKDRNRTGGIYLVLDPSMEGNSLLSRLRESLEGGIQWVQIWDNWPVDFDRDVKLELVNIVVDIAQEHAVPVLINEDWELLLATALSGVHFDSIPLNFTQIKQALPQDAIIGITCSNDLEVVKWAERQQVDYISFCAIFPSSSVDTCEIVSHDTLRQARSLTAMPLFVSGGITPENLNQLHELDISGVAVISGIMNNEQPKLAALAYAKALKTYKNEENTVK